MMKNKTTLIKEEIYGQDLWRVFMGHVLILLVPNQMYTYFSSVSDQAVQYSSYLVDLHTLKLKQYMPTILNPTVEVTMN